MMSKSFSADIKERKCLGHSAVKNEGEPRSLHVMRWDMPECLNTDVLILFVSTGLVRITDKGHNISLATPPWCIVSTALRLLSRMLIVFWQVEKKTNKKKWSCNFSDAWTQKTLSTSLVAIRCVGQQQTWLVLLTGLFHGAHGGKSIWAPVLWSPWSSASIPPVSEVVFASEEKKKGKQTVVVL